MGRYTCAAAEESGLPSASTASATWLARIRDCDAALRLRLWLGHPVVPYVNERCVESSAQEDASLRRAMKRAAMDEITELSSARRGGATDRAPRRKGSLFSVGGPPRPLSLGPRAGVGLGLPNKTPSIKFRNAKNAACAAPSPRAGLHRIGFILPQFVFGCQAES